MDASAPLVIEVRGLVKHYQGLRPLRIASLEVRSGERVSLAGLDATAAEVLVNLLNGAIVPDEGEVAVFGRPTAAIRDESEWLSHLDRLGIVTARAVLLDGPTVRQNLALPFTLEIDALPADVHEKTQTLAADVGIEAPMLDRPAGEAPAHVRMRARLARALALGPELLLLEHPTAGIERDQAPGFARTVRYVADARGLTVLTVTEDAGFAEVIGGRALRLQAGTGALVNARGWRRWF
jgi:ABC-type transporter Mla maintaining outer membrane lipid asymmetry ATPase subunit MlaF